MIQLHLVQQVEPSKRDSSTPSVVSLPSSASIHSVPSATTIEPSSMPQPSYVKLPNPHNFSCLHIHMLHEQCGHISNLMIHEQPCNLPYYGWVKSEAPSTTDCTLDTARRLWVIKKGTCEECGPQVVAVENAGLFGWGRKEVVAKNLNALLVQEVIKNRQMFLREIGFQEQRKKRKQLEKWDEIRQERQ